MEDLFHIIISLIACATVIKFFILPNVRALRKYFRLKKKGILHNAEVIDYAEETNADGVVFCFPVIRFFAYHGKMITGKLSSGKRKSELAQKKFIDIRYDPIHPDIFMEKSAEPFIISLLSLGVAVTVCLMPVYYSLTAI